MGDSWLSGFDNGFAPSSHFPQRPPADQAKPELVWALRQHLDEPGREQQETPDANQNRAWQGDPLRYRLLEPIHSSDQLLGRWRNVAADPRYDRIAPICPLPSPVTHQSVQQYIPPQALSADHLVAQGDQFLPSANFIHPCRCMQPASAGLFPNVRNVDDVERQLLSRKVEKRTRYFLRNVNFQDNRNPCKVRVDAVTVRYVRPQTAAEATGEAESALQTTA